MEQKQPQQPTKPAQTGTAQTADGTAAKRRRRRGGRRHGGGDKSATGSQGGNPAPAAPLTEKAGQAAQKPPLAQRGAPMKPAPKPAPKTAPKVAAPALPEQDDSIQVISRKAPAQKYASFEDYMKAHE